jgi:hypothetical protein
VEKHQDACAEILATRIRSLQKCRIENIWIRLNDLLDSEYDASRVLGFGTDKFRKMLLTLKVLQGSRYYVNRLNMALRKRGIDVETSVYIIALPHNSRVDMKHV